MAAVRALRGLVLGGMTGQAFSTVAGAQPGQPLDAPIDLSEFRQAIAMPVAGSLLVAPPSLGAMPC